MPQRAPRVFSSPFAERVYAVVAKIPKGKTMTYKEVATKAGNPNAARAVGMYMSRNYRAEIPCHRVVRSDGGMGGYNRGGSEKKEEMLRKEREGNSSYKKEASRYSARRK
jgi:O-6-methylguanine DNA methyltransferase